MKWIALLLFSWTAAAEPEPRVQTVREVQTIALADGFQGADVTVEGAVTWSDPDEGAYFFIQDATGGIQINYAGSDIPDFGKQIRVTGRLSAGAFAPVIDRSTIEDLGTGRLPKPPYGSGGGLLNGSFNSELIETDGWIRTAEWVGPDTIVAVLDSGASRISFRASNVKKLDPANMIAAKAYVRGVACPVRARAATGQLLEVQVLISRESDVSVYQRETVSPWDNPPTPLRTAFRYHPGQTRADRLQVRGTVLHVGDGIAWLHDGDSGLALRGSAIDGMHRGDRVAVVGFRDLQDFLPVLSDIVVRKDELPGIELKPKELPAWQLQDGLHHADLVKVSGLLLDRIETPADSGQRHLVLALQSPRGVFTAELDATSSGIPAGGLETGSLLQVTGICAVQTDPAGDPAGFKMILPDAASIHILEPAPFFTVRRMLVLLSITLGVLLAVAIAAFLLARRNAGLRTEVHQRQAVAAERGRLARDLHDTLEQGLTGLQLQIRGIGLSLSETLPDAHARLDAMKGLVQQCRTEVRQSIWDLRAEALENFDLGDALHRMAQSLFLGSGVRVEFRQHRSNAKIPGLIGDNLLRIGQEAMTNVLKHAQAELITIELTTDNQSVILSVSDDGRGFADLPPRESGPGHFGLAGMDERATRIGASLSIGGRPGGGSTVRVEVPLQPDPPVSGR
ncbi:histidine kinase [Luteolibacter sp. Populi]|uniref:histidine kinase n=1 Tax=Luteolibacter sp. Populi TaxID=3230487 RepID=UPI0034669968